MDSWEFPQDRHLPPSSLVRLPVSNCGAAGPSSIRTVSGSCNLREPELCAFQAPCVGRKKVAQFFCIYIYKWNVNVVCINSIYNYVIVSIYKYPIHIYIYKYILYHIHSYTVCIDRRRLTIAVCRAAMGRPTFVTHRTFCTSLRGVVIPLKESSMGGVGCFVQRVFVSGWKRQKGSLGSLSSLDLHQPRSFSRSSHPTLKGYARGILNSGWNANFESQFTTFQDFACSFFCALSLDWWLDYYEHAKEAPWSPWEVHFEKVVCSSY